jgi:hypothetical protein
MSHLDIAKKCWKDFAQQNTPPIARPFCPSEPAVGFLSAYAVTKQPEWSELARKQLEYAAQLEQDGLLLVRKGSSERNYIHRDTQARQIYNYYLAFRVLGDPEYYRKAVYCAEQMIRALPRKDHGVRGRTFKLFTAEFFDVVTVPRSSIPAPTDYSVDVNQNAEVGLAFALLAADPAPLPAFPQLPSLLLTKSECQAIAMRETMASMLVQNEATGEVPLREDRPEPDTMYGSYGCFSWVWVTMLDIFGPELGTDFLYMKPQFAAHIFSASNWLKKKMNLHTGRDKYYPSVATGIPVGPSEYTWRLALYWFCYTRGVNSFIEDIFAYMGSSSVDNNDSFVAAWAYYVVMGFPLALLGVTV